MTGIIRQTVRSRLLRTVVGGALPVWLALPCIFAESVPEAGEIGVPRTLWVSALSGDDVAHDGLAAEAPFRTLAKAVETAADGDLIRVGAGVYAAFDVGTKVLTIESTDGCDSTFIDGGGTTRCATLGTNAVMRGFTLRHGFAHGEGVAACGGGLRGGRAVDCRIERCLAGLGGGAFDAELENCTVTSCAAELGGGLCAGTAQGCSFANNFGVQGGAVYEAACETCVDAWNVDLSAGARLRLPEGASATGRTLFVAAGESIQSALLQAADGDTIQVAAGTFAPFDATDRAVTIIGAGAGATIVDAQGNGRAATFAPFFDPRTCRVSGMTFRNGATDDVRLGGGAVAGGILTACVLEASSASYGGGAAWSALTRCIVRANRAVSYGGGVAAGVLDNCLVEANVVVAGDVEAVPGFAAADMVGSGGGVAAVAATFCTIVKNRAPSGTGGGSFRSAVADSLVLGNVCPDGMDYFDAPGAVGPDHVATPDGDYYGSGCLDVPAQTTFVDWDAGDYRLRTDSACVDAASCAASGVASALDLAGSARWQASAPDLGCYETSVAVAPESVSGFAAASDDEPGVVLTWRPTRHAERYALYRASENDSSQAVLLDRAGGRATSLRDASAVEGEIYWYWIVAENDLGTSPDSAVCTGHWCRPLAIATTALPKGRPAVDYAAELSATGGAQPYVWRGESAGYRFDVQSGSTFSDADGELLLAGADDNWAPVVTLPFAFPFAGRPRKHVCLNANGLLVFADEVPSWSDVYEPSASRLACVPALAPFWNDLTEVSIAQTLSEGAVTFRWSGLSGAEGTPASFAVTLRADGSAVYSYGAGNTAGGGAAVGFSDGEGVCRLDTVQDALSGANDRLLRTSGLPGWLSLVGNRLVGTPAELGCSTIDIAVEDAFGSRAEKTFLLEITPAGEVPVDAYAAWAAAQGLGTAEEVTDGVANLFRYAFDCPAGPLPFPLLSIEIGAEGRPVVKTPVLVHPVGLTVRLRATTDVRDWSQAVDVPLSPGADGRLTFEDACGTGRFYRLKAER